MPSISTMFAIPDPITTPAPLSAGLFDEVCEAVLCQADEASCRAVATRLVCEIHNTLSRLHPDPSQPERASFQRVLHEVEPHQARLVNLPGSPALPEEASAR